MWQKFTSQDSCYAVQVLIEYGADLNAVNTFGRTPVNLATEDNRPSVVAALISAGEETYLHSVT